MFVLCIRFQGFLLNISFITLIIIHYVYFNLTRILLFLFLLGLLNNLFSETFHICVSNHITISSRVILGKWHKLIIQSPRLFLNFFWLLILGFAIVGFFHHRLVNWNLMCLLFWCISFGVVLCYHRLYIFGYCEWVLCVKQFLIVFNLEFLFVYLLLKRLLIFHFYFRVT